MGVTVNGACPKYMTVGEAVPTPENARDSQAFPSKDRDIGVNSFVIQYATCGRSSHSNSSTLSSHLDLPFLYHRGVRHDALELDIPHNLRP